MRAGRLPWVPWVPRVPRVLRVLPSLIVVACATHPKPPVERFNNAERVDPADFPDAKAVILLDRTEVTYFPPAGKDSVVAEVVSTRRTQIATEAGLDQARVLVPFDERSRILSIESKVIHPDGTREETHPDAFVDVERFPTGSPAARLYEGKGYKLTKVHGARVGDVIETTVLRFVRDPRWLEPITVGGPLPFVRGEVVVNVPKGFDVDFRVTREGRIVEGVTPTRIPTHVKAITATPNPQFADGLPGTRFAFVFDREPALFPEGDAPDESALATQVHVRLLRYQPDRGREGRGFSTFDDVAAWYRELTHGLDQPDAATKELAKRLGRGGKTERLRAVQRYLQDEVADVPTFLNLAALPAHGPADVVKARVGDAKDQASLGLALLRQMGLDGFPVLVSRQGSFASVPDLPTPAPFNHVVIAVPTGGAYAFIDPSTPGLPTGRLPGALQGEKGVLVRPDRGELIDLPEDKPEDNVDALDVELEMAPDGTLSGQVKATLSGVDAAAARTALESDDAPTRLQPILFGDPGGAPDLLPGLEIVEAFRVAGKSAGADDALKLQLRVKPLAPLDHRPFDVIPERAVGRPFAFLWREGRKAPVVLDHRGIYKVKLSVKMPPGKGVQSLPASLEKSGSILNVEEQWAVADGAFWLNRTMRVESRVVPPERYDELRAAAQALWGRQQTPIVVVDGGDRGKKYNGDPF